MGQAADMNATQHGPKGGWSLERAFANPHWIPRYGESGDEIVPNGIDPRVAKNRSPSHSAPVL